MCCGGGCVLWGWRVCVVGEEGVCYGGGCVLRERVCVVFVNVVLIHWSAIAQGTGVSWLPRYN